MTDEQKKDVKEAAEEVKEAAEKVKEAAKDAAEGKVEEAKEEAKKAEDKAEEAKEAAEEVKSEEKPEPTGKFKELIKEIEGLTALELAELVKALEERFGVSAAAPVAVAGGGAGEAAGSEGDEEKANYNVMLKDGGGNKIAAIKAIREVLPELGLVEAKTLVESAPKAVKENVPTEEAKAMKEKLEAAGATVELQ